MSAYPKNASNGVSGILPGGASYGSRPTPAQRQASAPTGYNAPQKEVNRYNDTFKSNVFAH